MSKRLIEQVLRQVIVDEHLHENTLRHGRVNRRERRFTEPMAPILPDCYAEVTTFNLFHNEKDIDIVCFHTPPINGQKPVIMHANDPNIKASLEAKHYSPHQSGTLRTYLNYSLGGPIRDLLKLIDCGFNKMFILQLQTEIVDFAIHLPFTYANLLHDFSFFNWLGVTQPAARANMARIAAQNRITELEADSRLKLDSNLIYGNMAGLITDPIADIKVKIHYLISGPFYRTALVPRLVAQRYDPDHHSCEEQAVEEGRVLTTNVRIESDPEA